MLHFTLKNFFFFNHFRSKNKKRKEKKKWTRTQLIGPLLALLLNPHESKSSTPCMRKMNFFFLPNSFILPKSELMNGRDHMEPKDDPQCRASLNLTSTMASLSHSNEAN